MSLKSNDVLTQLILSIFRVNGCLLESGNQLVEPLGLTSARWQILGAIGTTGAPVTCPQIAKIMGITRQGALKQLDLLESEGLVQALKNNQNERSPLYELTVLGRRKYAAAMKLQEKWVGGLTAKLQLKDLVVANKVLDQLIEELEIPDSKIHTRKHESISKMPS